jgi:hypothetical protein
MPHGGGSCHLFYDVVPSWIKNLPQKGDHHSLRPVFDRIVYQKTLLEMMQAGYLVDLRAFQVLLQADFDALRTAQGDFVEAELEHEDVSHVLGPLRWLVQTHTD